MASLTVPEMRATLAKLYPGKGFLYRLNHMMKDNQVIAIFDSITRKREKLISLKPGDAKWRNIVMSMNGQELTRRCKVYETIKPPTTIAPATQNLRGLNATLRVIDEFAFSEPHQITLEEYSNGKIHE